MSEEWSNRHREVRIARGRGYNLGKAKNQTLSWARFCKLFENPPRTSEKHRAYLRLPKTEQDHLKSSDGWYLGGPVNDGKRRKSSITERDIITIDIDDCTPGLYALIQENELGIADFEYVAHTTRKHMALSPRVRLNFLLARPVPAERYDAVSRILAHQIDSALDAVDDVSFRVAQMMFMPTCSADQAYETWVNKGKLLDADKLLESWPSDWRDFQNLPFSESRGQKRPTAEKAENPLEKRGPVGAFCRAYYPIQEAIDAFLPDVYAPGDSNSGKPRYSFLGGSTSNGVVVEDDGLFIYSHHGTDPCSDRLVNAFDMVRLHKFGDEDDGKDLEGLPITQHPSFKAMLGWAKEDRKVQSEMIAESIDIAAMFDDIDDMDEEEVEQFKEEVESGRDLDSEIADLLGETRDDKMAGLPPYPGSNPLRKPKKGWTQDLEPGTDGAPKATIYNIAGIVAKDPRTFGMIARNVFSGKIVARRALKSKIDLVPRIAVHDKENGLPWQDEHDASVRVLLESPRGDKQPGWGMKVSDRDLRDAILLVAKRNEFHPVIDRLVDLKPWDGEERAEALFIEYLGCPDTPYHREAARQFLLACIARLFCPGHKFDFMPVISGPQGCRKTTFVEALAWDIYGKELTADMDGGKEAVEQMLGGWIMEVGELSAMRRSEVEAIKAFITRRKDDVRLAYDRRNTIFERQTLLMGTTNEDEYLKDNTGNRRFWPLKVQVEVIDIDRLRENIDQIWAEALVLYRKTIAVQDYRRIKFGLTGEAEAEARQHQDGARVESADDQTFGRIHHFLEEPRRLSDFISETFTDEEDENTWVVPTKVCVELLIHEALHESPRSPQQANAWSGSIGRVMKRMKGWVKYSEMVRGSGVLSFGDYGKQRAIVREDASTLEIRRGYRVVRGPEEPGDGPEIELPL